MMFRHLIIFIITALLVSSCSKLSDLEELEKPDVVPVTFSIAGILQHAHTTETRVEEEAELPEEEAELPEEGTTVRILVYKRIGSAVDPSQDSYVTENTYYVNSDGDLIACKVNDVGEIISGTSEEMKLKPDTYDFYAIMPALKVTRSTKHTVSVPHGIDYASSVTPGKTVDTSSREVNLTLLDRKCTKIEFKVDRLSESIHRVDMEEVVLTPLADTPQTIGLGGNILPNAYTTSVILKSGVFTTSTITPYKVSGSTIVLPCAAGDIMLTMKLRFNGTSKIVTLGPTTIRGISLVKGYRYVFKVTLQNGRIYLEISVADWTGEVNWSTPVGSGPISVDGWDTEEWSTSEGGDILITEAWNTIPGWNANTGEGPDAEGDWESKNWATGVGHGSGTDGWNGDDWDSDVGEDFGNDWTSGDWNTDIGI